MPQLCAMSVAFEAQGDTVPKRGVTTIMLPATSTRAPGLAVRQQRSQPFPLGRLERMVGGNQVHEPRSQAGQLRVNALQPGQELLDSKLAEGAAAFEGGDVQGHCAYL